MGNPWLLTKSLYVNPNTQAAQWCAANPNDPRTPSIQANIASVPTALWLGGGNVHDWIAGYVSDAYNHQALPVLALYAFPSYLGTGMTAANNYRSLVDQVVSAVGSRPCVVQLETDSLISCVGASNTFRLQRFWLLQYAVSQFSKLCPNTWTYLDGGDAYYNSPTTMAPLLVQAGVGMAAGFSLNVSNFNTNTTMTSFAAAVNQQLATYGIPAKAWIGDCSRNGNGRPDPAYISAHPNTWMFNPPGMKLGQRPNMSGLLWIKRPGESDGQAGIVTDVPGGEFDPRLAMALINGATTA